MNNFIIEYKLPSFNEYVNECRKNAFAGAKFKKDIENTIFYYIRWAIIRKTLNVPKKFPIELNIEWHEANKKRDCDNIKSAVKFILDTMVKSEIIPDDNRKYISQIHDTIIDDKSTYVKVEIIEKEE